jgi:SAM-dependent methyltransferase
VLGHFLASLRDWRRRTARWSAGEDRRFHDSLFGAQAHDPFSPSYPGYITIQRFADLAAAHLHDTTRVLDLGCGPGEITCELARRRPDVSFTGVDHSAIAVERATQNAARLGLSNVRFEASDLAAYSPRDRVDLVAMFDAFHHLLEPVAFVRHASRYADRFFLIEPAGDAFGRWRRALDFDWVPCELDKIRARIEHTLGDGVAAASPGLPAGEPAVGRAVENRYPEADYRRFFAGFNLEIRGTVAGLDVYPPLPGYHSACRARAMHAAYDLLTSIDDDLYRRSLDLHAKHWAIYATRGGAVLSPGGFAPPDPPARSLAGTPDSPRRSRGSLAPLVRSPEPPGLHVQGAFDAAYTDPDIPEVMRTLQDVTVDITVRNSSWREWRSEQTPHPILLSYHWLDARRGPIEYDGVRTPLPRPVAPGESCAMTMRVRAPAKPGRYVLEIDLVEEDVSWFSRAGTRPLRSLVRVS